MAKLIAKGSRTPNSTFIAVIDEMSEESDRAAVLVGSAYLEETLALAISHALRDRLHPDRAAKHLFKPGGVLSDFMAKARTAYALGIIDAASFAQF